MKSNRKNIPCELKGEPLAVLNAMAGRAEYLYHIVKALDEAGVKNVDEILKKATYNVGRTWAEEAGDPKNPHEWWSNRLSESKRQILKLDWVRDEEDEIELHFYRCPLVFGWQRMGVEPKMIERLCKIAHQVDYGNVESFDFKLDMDPGLGRGDKRCTLIIRKKK
jgi:hypothetical protein